MNLINKGAIGLLAVISVFKVNAQSNPGYLGNTQAIEISTNYYIPGLMAHGPWLKNHTSISYEKSSSKSFSWRGGIRFGSGEFDAEEDLSNYNVEVTDPFGSYQFTSPGSGTLGYSLTEFFIAPRWYNNNSGAIAPFGNFWGLEIAYANVGIKDEIVWNSRAIDLPAITKGFSHLSMAIQWGSRRVIFDNLCYDYHLGVGFNVWNSGNASVAYFEDGTEYDDHEAVVHSMVLAPVAWGRIFHGGVGLSYLF